MFQISCSDDNGIEIVEIDYDSIKINGINLTSTKDPLTQNNIDPMESIHINFISLIPFAFINNLNTPHIRYNTNWQWFGETTEGIQQYAYELNKTQIKIIIKPQIWVQDGTFTGDIDLSSEEDWLILENSYENYILEYARIAQEINAEIFCIGTELEKFVTYRPNFWLELIAKIKSIFSGKLTYAANWDEYKNISLWNELDFIGIDAYFPLSNSKSPSLEDLENGWVYYKQEIRRVQSIFQKPVIFTEYGYRSINFAAKQPWVFDEVVGEVNLSNQANALQALYNEFWEEDWFLGGFLWKWFPDHENAGGINDNRFTIQNKPAEEITRQNYELYP